MLSAHNLACERGGRVLFANLDFSLDRGDLLHIRGANGSGKTTLLRTLCGLSQPAQGEILWNDRAIADTRENFHANLCYIGHRNGLHGDLTPLENLQSHCALHGQHDADTAQNVLTDSGLVELLHTPVKHLSQGQQRRVALADMLLRNTMLWILDEPFTALDVAAVDWLIARIVMHLANGGMIIMTTHQETAVREHITHEVVLMAEIGP
ncbi:MAG: cytochrome c biogenesis heme-transporting ATPase CcmA [Granulosicoccaceae bacterium]|jgi:heme exporter protein A